MTRTFIALEMDEVQQHFLGKVIKQGKQILPDLHWVETSGIHLTLAFLGELNEQQLALAIEAAEYAAAQSDPFNYRLSSPGIFGPQRNPRVLWMGISEPAGVLTVVHQILKQALEKRGFSTEERAFSPHLTLARVKSSLSPEQLQQLQNFISQHHFASPAYHVTHLNVMKSELSRSGANYTCLQAWPFKKATPAGSR